MSTNPYLQHNPNEGNDMKSTNQLGGGYPSLSQPGQNDVSNQNIVYGQPMYQGQQPGYQNNQPYPPQYPNQNVITVNVGRQTGGVFPNCYICKKNTQTILRHKSGGLVWIMALVFCFFTGCLCFIPFFIDQWKDK